MFSLSAVSFRSKLLIPNLTRSLVNRATNRTLPAETESVTTPNDFLKKIGRSMDTKMSVEDTDWRSFWIFTSGLTLRKSGMAVRDRRYLLWCMEKFRQGVPIEEFAHEPKPKKTVRGWGPSVQNGKRIRSRRLKNKK